MYDKFKFMVKALCGRNTCNHLKKFIVGFRGVRSFSSRGGGVKKYNLQKYRGSLGNLKNLQLKGEGLGFFLPPVSPPVHAPGLMPLEPSTICRQLTFFLFVRQFCNTYQQLTTKMCLSSVSKYLHKINLHENAMQRFRVL